MKINKMPAFSPETPGPWGVDTGNSQRYWYVIHRVTGRAKRIGPVIGFVKHGQSRPNYFGRAIEEADRRNRELIGRGA